MWDPQGIGTGSFLLAPAIGNEISMRTDSVAYLKAGTPGYYI